MTKYTNYTNLVYMVYVNDNSPISKIGKAAADLVFSYGVKGWNMDDCSKAAGITKRTLYQHIENKEKLIEHVLLQFIHSVQKDLAQQFTNCTDYISGLDHLVGVFPKMLMRMESRHMQDIFLTYPEIEKTIIAARQEIAKETIDFIRQGQEQGHIKKQIDADTILEILQSLVLFYAKSNPHQFETKLRNAFKTVLSGILV